MRLIPLLVALVLALPLAGCGDDETTTTTTTTETSTTETTETTATDTTTTDTTETTPPGPTVVRVRVVGGAPQGGIVRETVSQGDGVAIVVTSDVADEVHLHGYDISRDVAAGGTARLVFRATVPGRFEVELEDRSLQIADITVQP
jgi:outer membrane lipoprotein SlyB